jgi:TatD DNase family protein
VAPPRLFDSHCHLQDPAFDEDRSDVLARALEAGVAEIAVIASDPGSAAAARDLTADPGLADRPQLVWTAGVHPHVAETWNDRARRELERLLDAGAAAVGEIGLDFHYDHSSRDAQRDAFAEQLALAVARDLPVVVHSREADEATLDLVEASGIAAERVVLHSFSGGVPMLERAIEAGTYVSFSGMVTFRTFPAETLVAKVPADRLLAETDAPYLAPVPHRGRRNEPAFLAQTVERLAALHGVDVTAMGALTRANARRFYGLEVPAGLEG